MSRPSIRIAADADALRPRLHSVAEKLETLTRLAMRHGERLRDDDAELVVLLGLIDDQANALRRLADG